ncbi:MAG TPA: hypothetical protein VFE46_19700 [Pirellulales bacterium]|jgi:hypothetical protein|nr:hypothetical protein [Pirellulales bacterium]
MKLPNLQAAEVSENKVKSYLLSTTHRDGRHKAAFFAGCGFSEDHWTVLSAALLKHAHDHDLAKIEKSPFGTRYVVEGIIETPDGRAPLIRTVWFVENGEDVPRLISAYPRKRKNQ